MSVDVGAKRGSVSFFAASSIRHFFGEHPRQGAATAAATRIATRGATKRPLCGLRCEADSPVRSDPLRGGMATSPIDWQREGDSVVLENGPPGARELLPGGAALGVRATHERSDHRRDVDGDVFVPLAAIDGVGHTQVGIEEEEAGERA